MILDLIRYLSAVVGRIGRAGSNFSMHKIFPEVNNECAL